MTENTQVFYYSRKKIGQYLLFNVGLMALALLFTWSVYPDYEFIYFFALITCSLSVISCILVYLNHLPVAEISKDGIKIDNNQIVAWKQIKSVKKEKYSRIGKKYFLKIESNVPQDYKMSCMQRLAKHSKFGAFSIPLYAMDDNDAKRIEKIIKDYTAGKSTAKTESKSKKTKTALKTPKKAKASAVKKNKTAKKGTSKKGA
ncbi:MAG: hypothetical protein MJ210_00065 [Alphaproteobacteria bacterium]|nr:hypothetical protein [Alphaproteobacteria bacterium]